MILLASDSEAYRWALFAAAGATLEEARAVYLMTTPGVMPDEVPCAEVEE